MYLLTNLVNFYQSTSYNWIIMLLISWMLWPGLMFLIGAIGESRLVPIWDHQSRAFFPGDMVFGVLFIALIAMFSRAQSDDSLSKVPTGITNVCCCIAILFVIVVLIPYLYRDGLNYPIRARYSPTKITHDLVGYIILPTILLFLTFLQIYIQMELVKGIYLREWLIAVAAIAFYVICVAVDIKQGWTDLDVMMRHPENWSPIWMRKN